MALIDAAKNGNLETVLTELETGYGANTRDNDDATALYWSACHGHDDVTEILISAGCDVNAMVRWGSTALHAAADRGHVHCVQILINSGARTNSTNDRGDTSLHIAAYRGFLEITRMLLLAGSDVTLKNGKGKTPQEEAMEGGNHEIAECIRIFVTEGHFSLSTKHLVHHRDNIYGDSTIYCNTQTTNIRPTLTARLHSLTSEYSSDVSDSTTSSTFNSTSSFPEESFDSGTEQGPPRRTRPAVNLQRSVSFGGTHNTHRRTSSHPTFLNVPRTASAESVQCQIPAANHVMRTNNMNVMNGTFTSVPMGRLCVSERNLYQNRVLTNGVSTKNGRPSSAPRQVMFTNQGQSSATESSDFSPASLRELNGIERFTRPVSAEVGDHTNTDEVIAKLQNQLVQSYRQIEYQTKENEHLKFKSSTLLERLNETEAKLAETNEKCETLVSLLEMERSRKTLEREETALQQHNRESNGAIPLEGFTELVSRFADSPNELEKRLHDTVLSMSSRFSKTVVGPTQQWLPGNDYVILGDPPVSASMDHKTPRFVSFLVKHLKTNQCFILKMEIKLEVQSPTHTTSNKSVDLASMTARYHSQPNIIKVLHQFESATDRLKKFVYLAPPSDPYLPQPQLVDRTVFLVTPYLLTLNRLIDMSNDPESVSDCSELDALFWVQVLYQLSSVLCLVEEKGLTYGDIDRDTVGFDEDLVPYLKNIENVIDINLCSETTGDSMTDRPRKHEGQLNSINDLKKDLNKKCVSSDVQRLCKLFQDVLSASQSGTVHLTPDLRRNGQPPPLEKRLRRVLSDALEPTSYLFNESNMARNVAKRLGFLLFGPSLHVVQNETDCSIDHQTHMLKLLTEIPSCKSDQGVFPSNKFSIGMLLRDHVLERYLGRPLFESLLITTRIRKDSNIGVLERSTTNQYGVYKSMRESVRTNICRIEAHFRCHVTSRDLWNLYQTFEQNGLLVE